MVCSLLHNLDTDNAASSGDEMSSSGTDYGLSDPEAGMWNPCHIETDTYEELLMDELVTVDTIDSISTTMYVRGEEFTSGTAMDTGKSDGTNYESVSRLTLTSAVERQTPELSATSPILVSDLLTHKMHITGALDGPRIGVPFEVGQMYEKLKVKLKVRSS